MEDVLDLYEEPYDPQRPVVCMDESPKQLLKDVREPQPCAPHCPARQDHEYERNGMRNLFIFCEPQTGQCRIDVTAQRTMQDFARFMQQLDKQYADATVIRVVLDNLNTHAAKSFYEAFEPEEARRLAKRFEFHYTPKHGSWLNMAEIELAAANKVSLARRIGDEELLKREVAAYVRDRNARETPIQWRFTTRDARAKLKRLYPVASSG
jgi:DDE superfamily endonuclease